MGWSIVSNQIKRLDKEQQRRAGSVQNRDMYEFTISPTCPPSTSIIFRGGLIWRTAAGTNSYGWYIPSYEVDLTDPYITYSSSVCPNAYWYYAVNIVPNTYYLPGLTAKEEWPETAPERSIYFREVSEWVETAATAENNVLRNERSSGQFYGPCTTSVILRNNGNTVDINQYMPIDPVNRGRSYLFMNITPGWHTV